MAQRTAFLNSDAKGFNKDFHHTWISNYMLKQPGVMFSNYTTKPEFALGNGQISGGKAIIRCTRTTGTFAGEEILACFESTSTENISTAGNKKVYIEIPEVYVNDSTAITDSLTQGANLNVGRIVSSDSYPTHSNYIPLWEITNGDWQNATDLRPEVLRNGKPNTLSYFGGNGEEKRIDIDNSSLNKYLMSNGAGVAPSWEEGGGGGGGSSESLKKVFTADETISAKGMFGVEVMPTLSDINTYVNIGDGESDKVSFDVVLNGEDFGSLKLNLKSVNSPADSISVRIETVDNDGFPTGTLVNVGAYGTVTPTGTATDMTVNLGGTISGLTAHTKAAIVLQRTGTPSSSNYFQMGAMAVNHTYSLGVVVYEAGGSWAYRGSVPNHGKGCTSSDGFATEAVVKATTRNKVTPIGYCETGALGGNEFTGIVDGIADYSGAKAGETYYLRYDGTLSTFGNGVAVAVGVASDEIRLTLSGGEKVTVLTDNANIWELSEGNYITEYDLYYKSGEKIQVASGNKKQLIQVIKQAGGQRGYFVFNVGQSGSSTRSRASFGYSNSSSDGTSFRLGAWDASFEMYAPAEGQSMDFYGIGDDGLTQLVPNIKGTQTLTVGTSALYPGVTYTLVAQSVTSGQTYSVVVNGTSVTNPLNISLPSSSTKPCVITLYATDETHAIVTSCIIGS